jgi:hypothetical protein
MRIHALQLTTGWPEHPVGCIQPRITIVQIIFHAMWKLQHALHRGIVDRGCENSQDLRQDGCEPGILNFTGRRTSFSSLAHFLLRNLTMAAATRKSAYTSSRGLKPKKGSALPKNTCPWLKKVCHTHVAACSVSYRRSGPGYAMPRQTG